MRRMGNRFSVVFIVRDKTRKVLVAGVFIEDNGKHKIITILCVYVCLSVSVCVCVASMPSALYEEENKQTIAKVYTMKNGRRKTLIVV